MTTVNEGAHIYDAAADAIKLDYNFDRTDAQLLFNLFNDTTPTLLSLYEKREFLTYFFLGTHTIPALTPQQAWDFKTSFDIRNFPANGIPEYITWLNSNGNNYMNAFPYPMIDGNGRVKYNKWKIAYIGDIIKDLTLLVDDQHNYNNWLADVQNGNGSWEVAVEKLSQARNVGNFFAKLAGLFATGKFVKYYEDYVKPDIQKVTNHAIFDPYTGNITIKQQDDSYTVLFGNLIKKSDDYANNLMNKGYINNKTLSYQHRLFCLLCQWLANSFESFALDKVDPEVKKDIKTFWDFTPSTEKGVLPSDPYTERRLLIDSGIIGYIRYSGRMFLEETLKLDDGNTSYKELWDGAKMKLGSGELIDCPFYYVIHVDFDSIDPDDNPFAGKDLTRMNEKIAEIIAYRDTISKDLQSIFKNVTDLKTCGTTVTNLSTVIFDKGSTKNNLIMDASCTMDSDGNTTTESSKTVTSEENSFDPDNIKTDFELNRLADNEKKSSDKNNDKIKKDDEEEEIVEVKDNKIIIMIAIIAAIIIVIGIGIWLYKRKKNNDTKNTESIANP